MSLGTPPLALYVHFPWCVRKCPYCDFNSYTLHAELAEQAYVEALIGDLEHQAPQVSGRRLTSIFLGGGTPSLFSAEAIARVLESARRLIGCEEDIEVTLEANPGTTERGRFIEYRAAGVNRVSLGAQSFEEARLAALGRIHTARDTCRAAEELHATGLKNFNLDLMYALPGQDAQGALRDLDAALGLRPAHVSHYQLTLEPGTLFGARPPADLPSEDETADMLARCEERLAHSGYAHYEVSAYAAPGRQARHNLNYWTFGDYLGIGAGAHGKLTFASEERIVRTVQPREPRRYLAAPHAQCAPIAAEQLPFEFMLNALRLCAGIPSALFEMRTGLRVGRIAPTLKSLEDRGLLMSEGGLWRTTPLGARFLNELLLSFLPGADLPAKRALSTPAGAAMRTSGGRYAQAQSARPGNERITRHIT